MLPRRPTAREQALWTLQRLFPDSGVSNETVAFTVSGRLDVPALTEQLRLLAVRHPALRTVFPDLNGRPVAVVLPDEDATVTVAVFDEPAGPVEEEVADFAARAFDLTSDIPLRAGVWRGPDGDVCCLVLHHVIFDTWTAGVIVDELAVGYITAIEGLPRPKRLQDVVAPYVDPVPSPASVRYWRTHVAEADPQRQRMAIGRPDPDETTFAGAAREHQLSEDALAAVAEVAKRHRATENIVLLAAFAVLLAKHGAGPDLVVGVSVDARAPGHRDSIGYHVNTLPLRLPVEQAGTFADVLRRVRDTFLAGLEHGQTPYEAVLPDLRTVGSAWRTPLFRYMFNYRPLPVGATKVMSGTPVERIEVPPRFSRQDLEFIVETGDRAGRLRAVYSTELFDEADVRALQERYDTLLRALSGHDQKPLPDLTWWTDADRAVVDMANDTADDAALLSILDHIGAADPDAVAVVDGETETTYAELLAAAEGVRNRLVANGVGHGDVVAVHAHRGAALAAASLGVWAAGAAYLPLHTEHPAELVAFQLDDSKAKVLLAGRELPEGLDPNCLVLPLTQPEHAATPIRAAAALDDVAYVIYTSGSSGRPKAVELTHGNLANVVADFRTRLAVTERDAVLWLTTFAFDISALELFLPLSAGGRVVVAPDEVHGDPMLAVDAIRRHDIRIIQATPTTWSSLVTTAADALAGRVVLCGGEPLTPALAADLLDTGCYLFNVYGPTETTIWSTVGEVTGSRVDVGVPLRNTSVFVAGPDGSPMPPGVAGELCIAGHGVARGYPRLPDLTAERFAAVPGLGRYYRTGDRARWHYDGRIDLLGRVDRQVKIRGHRIELGEVEAVLTEHQAVQAAAVTVRDDQLVAFVQTTAEPSAELVESLWAHVRAKLASYALPARLVLGPLPRNASGKIDHAALASMPLQERGVGQGPHEHTALVDDVVRLWREVLADPGIGPADNFFLSGGDSALAARMLVRLAKSTGVTLTLTSLLDAPTATALAQRLAMRR